VWTLDLSLAEPISTPPLVRETLLAIRPGDFHVEDCILVRSEKIKTSLAVVHIIFYSFSPLPHMLVQSKRLLLAVHYKYFLEIQDWNDSHFDMED